MEVWVEGTPQGPHIIGQLSLRRAGVTGGFGRVVRIVHPAGFKVQLSFECQLSGIDEWPELADKVSWLRRQLADVSKT